MWQEQSSSRVSERGSTYECACGSFSRTADAGGSLLECGSSDGAEGGLAPNADARRYSPICDCRSHEHGYTSA